MCKKFSTLYLVFASCIPCWVFFFMYIYNRKRSVSQHHLHSMSNSLYFPFKFSTKIFTKRKWNMQMDDVKRCLCCRCSASDLNFAQTWFWSHAKSFGGILPKFSICIMHEIMKPWHKMWRVMSIFEVFLILFPISMHLIPYASPFRSLNYNIVSGLASVWFSGVSY